MNNMLIVYLASLTSGFVVERLNYIWLACIIYGILVVISKNPIVCVLSLIGLYLSISGYLFLLGLQYIGLAYLLVYVGAVSILFLFILMLISVRISELLFATGNSWPLAVFIGVLFIIIVGDSMPNNRIVVAQGASPVWDGALWATNHITSIGNMMYTDKSIWLIITSFILLLAMVGCIVITIKQDNIGSHNVGVVLDKQPPVIYSIYTRIKVLFFKTLTKIIKSKIFTLTNYYQALGIIYIGVYCGVYCIRNLGL